MCVYLDKEFFHKLPLGAVVINGYTFRVKKRYRNKKKLHEPLRYKLFKIQNEITKCKAKISELVKLNTELKATFSRLASLLSQQKRANTVSLRSEIYKYQKLKDFLKAKIDGYPPLKVLESDIYRLNQEHLKLKTEEFSSRMQIVLPKEEIPIRTITIDWSKITFQDSFISIYFENKWLDKYPIVNSKKIFNLIKSLYTVRNIPLLEITVKGNKVTEIKNKEALFFFMYLFETGEYLFNESKINKPELPIKFTKSYYKKHLPNIFSTRCFEYLAEKCSDNYPLIPIGELVKNKSTNHTAIHNSFLFPRTKGNTTIWFWESAEESKATYIFKTKSSEYIDHLQNIFNYLTGQTNNKRLNLINSETLQHELNYIVRIKHTDFGNWKRAVEKLVN